MSEEESVEARTMAHPRKMKERGAARARARTGTESAPDAAGAAAGVNGANLLTFSAAIARAKPGTACLRVHLAESQSTRKRDFLRGDDGGGSTKGRAALLKKRFPLHEDFFLGGGGNLVLCC